MLNDLLDGIDLTRKANDADSNYVDNSVRVQKQENNISHQTVQMLERIDKKSIRRSDITKGQMPARSDIVDKQVSDKEGEFQL